MIRASGIIKVQSLRWNASLQRESNPAAGLAHGFDRTDERWLLVEEILASRTFAKAARLSSFLSYVCQQTLEGKADQINEQMIGIHVFSRSPAYQANDDSIVRSQARLLRQKLDEYFEHERPGSPLVLQIPKGGYVPVFQRNSSMEPAKPSVQPVMDVPAAMPLPTLPVPAPNVPAETHTPSLAWLGWVVAAIAVVALVLSLTLHLGSKPQSSGMQRLIWSSLLNNERGALIVSSDDALVLVQELTRGPVSLDDYLSGSYIEKSALPAGSVPLSASWLNAHQYTSMADLTLAMRIARVPEALRFPPEARYARDVRMSDMKSRNVILIGGKGANPWVGLFESQLNFELNYDWKATQGYVANRSPHAGELPRYQELGPDGARHNYGVLAFLSGVGGAGDALLFEGTGMAGTESTADFLFHDEAFSAFAKQIGGARDGHMPHFEVLLEAPSIGGSAPQERVIAYRVLDH